MNKNEKTMSNSPSFTERVISKLILEGYLHAKNSRYDFCKENIVLQSSVNHYFNAWIFPKILNKKQSDDRET